MRYLNNKILKTSKGKQYFALKYYPNIPFSDEDQYIITNHGDRLDNLAFQYYKNVEMWWVIARANGLVGLLPPKGIQLRIPANISDILNTFEKINK